MQCTLMSGVQCLRAPGTVALKQSTCSRSIGLPASSLVANPLRFQQACRQIKLKRLSHTVVLAAVADTATFYDYAVKDIDGRNTQMKKFKGKVVLAVNVASQCGFTKQYRELGELYSKYEKQGLVILGFPCNQFNNQEPGNNREIKKFAKDKGADFPMMSKIKVNGPGAEPLYDFLKSQQGGVLTNDVKWNFTKFLVDKDGEVVKRYGSVTTPSSIEGDIKSALDA